MKLITRQWKSHGWKFILGCCFVFILVLVCVNRSVAGTFSDHVEFHGNLDTRVPEFSKSVPSGQSAGEHRCREVAERVFDKPFVSIRPDFLKNDVSGQNMELDCYNAELSLAIEYNGRQHYEYIPFFHASKDDYVKQRYRDEFKKLKCKENGVLLITIPYTVKLNNIERELKKEFRALGYFV